MRKPRNPKSNSIFADDFGGAIRGAKELSKSEAIAAKQLVYYAPGSCQKDNDHAWRYVANDHCVICHRRILSAGRQKAFAVENAGSGIDPEKRREIERRQEEKALRKELDDF